MATSLLIAHSLLVWSRHEGWLGLENLSGPLGVFRRVLRTLVWGGGPLCSRLVCLTNCQNLFRPRVYTCNLLLFQLASSRHDGTLRLFGEVPRGFRSPVLGRRIYQTSRRLWRYASKLGLFARSFVWDKCLGLFLCGRICCLRGCLGGGFLGRRRPSDLGGALWRNLRQCGRSIGGRRLWRSRYCARRSL